MTRSIKSWRAGSVLVGVVAVALDDRALAQSMPLLPPTTLTVTSPSGTALGDIDGDARLDLVLALGSPSRISIRTNSTGAFVQGPQVALPSASSLGRPVAADFNGDGDIDVAVGDPAGQRVWFIDNQWPNLVAIAAPVNVTLMPRELVAGDVDADGDFDLAVAGDGASFVALLINQGAFAWSLQTLSTPGAPRAVALGDLDLDGDLDLAAACSNQSFAIWLRSQGQFVAQTPIAMVNHAIVEDLKIGDIDGDGDADLVAACYVSINSVQFLEILRATSPGQFSALETQFFGSGHGGASTLADFDGDGDLDLAVAHILAQAVRVQRNDGTGTLNGPWANLLPMAFAAADIDSADVDGSGSPDLITTDSAGNNVRIYLNASVGTASAIQSYCTAKVSSIGTTPQITAVGVPSFGAAGFALRLSQAVPMRFAVLAASSFGPASLPFHQGVLCVQPPANRIAHRTTSSTGTALAPIAIPFSAAGTTRHYQWICRDPQQLDGSGVCISAGLAVTYGP